MEQKYAKSDSMKVVTGEEFENKLILNAGSPKDVLGENDIHKLLYPMKNITNDGFGISHLSQNMMPSLTKFVQPAIRDLQDEKCCLNKLFYLPLTCIYNDSTRQSRISLEYLYNTDDREIVDDDAKWALRRAILRYNFNFKIKWESNTEQFVNVLYIQRKDSYQVDEVDSFSKLLDDDFNFSLDDDDDELSIEEHEGRKIKVLSNILERGEEDFKLNGLQDWTILRRSMFSNRKQTGNKDGPYESNGSYESHGYIFPDKSYLQLNDNQELIMGNYPICMFIIKSHPDITLDVEFNDGTSLVSYLTFESQPKEN